MSTIQNAKQMPKRYFGLHMVEGIAEYKEPGKEPQRYLLNHNTLLEMNKTFEGKPVYVQHVDEVDLHNLHNEADGYVVKSFYNETDGKHWVEFLVTSDEGHEKIKQGWVLSNSYMPKMVIDGGEWHGVPFQNEIKKGEYDHLAIVNNPRYQESMVLTPEQFEKYNADLKAQIKKVSNSKDTQTKGEPMLSIFKREKVENSKALDLESMSVVLPKSKQEKTILQLVNEADEKASSKMCNMEDEVMVNDQKMTVGQILEQLKDLAAKVAELEAAPAADPAANAEDEEAKKKALELAAHEEKEIEAAKAKQNEEDEAKKKKENEAKEAEAKAKAEEGKKNFNSLKNAKDDALKNAKKETIRVDLSSDKVARGQSRYGST